MENNCNEDEENYDNYFGSSRPSSAWSRCDTPTENEGNTFRNNLSDNQTDSGADFFSNVKNGSRFSTLTRPISSPIALSDTDTDYTNDRDILPQTPSERSNLPQTPSQRSNLPQPQSGKHTLTNVAKLPQKAIPGIPSDIGGSVLAYRGKKIFPRKI